jgi:hypothetical protein
MNAKLVEKETKAEFHNHAIPHLFAPVTHVLNGPQSHLLVIYGLEERNSKNIYIAQIDVSQLQLNHIITEMSN